MGELCSQLEAGAGTLLISDERLDPHDTGPLVEKLCEQPRWSDLPILLLSGMHRGAAAEGWPATLLDNVTLLHEPVETDTLRSAVRAALRARQRQYEMRDYLADRNAAEQTLLASNARFRAFFDLAPVGIAEVDNATRRFTRVNDRLCQITGYSREELLSRSFDEITHPDDRLETVALADQLRGARSATTGWRNATFARTGVSSGFRLHVTSVPVRTWAGPVSFGIIQDITERKQAEEAIRHERTFLRKVIDAFPSLVFVKDRHGRFVLGNEVLYQEYGHGKQNVLGRTDADFNPNVEEVARFRRDDLEVMDTREPKLILEEKITYADGREHWLTTVKVPLIDSDGTCDQVLGVASDITERIRAEQALRESEQQTAGPECHAGTACRRANYRGPAACRAAQRVGGGADDG